MGCPLSLFALAKETKKHFKTKKILCIKKLTETFNRGPFLPSYLKRLNQFAIPLSNKITLTIVNTFIKL